MPRLDHVFRPLPSLSPLARLLGCCLLLGAVLIFVATAGAQQVGTQRAGAEPWSVSGVVVGADGAPLPGVQVVAGQDATRTNEQGRFTLRLRQPGPATLVFRLSGYRPMEKSIDNATSAVIVSMQPQQ